MNYIIWSIIALLGYTLFAPLVKLASVEIPSTVIAVVANTMLVIVALGVLIYTGEPVRTYLTVDSAIYMYAAGLALAAGILAYYYALALGPINIVVPIFGMFIVTSSIVGVIFLDESLSFQQSVGIAFAMLAIILVTVE